MNPIKQSFVGEVGDRCGEMELKLPADFYSLDYALELRKGKLLLFVVTARKVDRQVEVI